MATINGQDFDTTSYDKVTGKRIKENPTWGGKTQFRLLMGVGIALLAYIIFNFYTFIFYISSSYSKC